MVLLNLVFYAFMLEYNLMDSSLPSNSNVRNNNWLAGKLQQIVEQYFPDVAVQNRVFVRFFRVSKYRLGSITAKKRQGYEQPVTLININALFKDPLVPEYVIEATLFHEFSHYIHGFHSPLAQRFRHPHQGGVVTKEFKARGAQKILKEQRRWLRTEYPELLKRYGLHP